MTNPLLTKLKLPGRTFQLPSKGLLYGEGMFSEDVTAGEIHIHPLSSLTEITLKNPDSLISGLALSEVVKECIPSILKPMELYARDVDAIMFFLRIATYGNEYRIEVTHDCEKGVKHSYTADVEQIVTSMPMLDLTTVQDNQTVLVGGQTVITRPVLFKDLIGIFAANMGKKEFTTEDLKQLSTMNLVSMIESVDGITDRDLIIEWAKAIPSTYVNKITKSAEKLNDWGPKQIVDVKCRDCGEIMKVELPVNPINFFTE